VRTPTGRPGGPRKRRKRRTLRVSPGIALAGAVALASAAGGVALWRSPPAELPSLSAMLRAPRFQLRSVEVMGVHKLDPEVLLAGAPLEPGTPLIDVEVDPIAEHVARHPRVARCRGVRIPPNRLLLDVEERVPVARLAGSAEGIDLDGNRFPLLEDEREALPELRGDIDWTLPLLRNAAVRALAMEVVEAWGPADARFRPAGFDLEVRVGTDPGRALDDWIRLAGTGLVDEYGPRVVDLRFGDSAVLRDFEKTKGGAHDEE
jgi:hypothetical protein